MRTDRKMTKRPLVAQGYSSGTANRRIKLPAKYRGILGFFRGILKLVLIYCTTFSEPPNVILPSRGWEIQGAMLAPCFVENYQPVLKSKRRDRQNGHLTNLLSADGREVFPKGIRDKYSV
jgi:hypothetical protein